MKDTYLNRLQNSFIDILDDFAVHADDFKGKVRFTTTQSRRILDLVCTAIIYQKFSELTCHNDV